MNFDNGKYRQTISRKDFLNSVHDIREGFSKKVTFNTMDSIEQKIDKTDSDDG